MNKPWFSPMMGTEEELRVIEVLRSGFINEGDVAKNFENEAAKVAGTKYACCTTSGTVAIYLALKALGVGNGDEVICPDFTFIATANAIRLTGAEPVFVDIEEDRFCISVKLISEAMSPNTKAVVSVDVNGRGADYSVLEDFCKGESLFLITDSAEAFGSKYEGREIGSFGNAGCFSFSAAKTISTGQGGMISTNDETLYHRIKELKDQGRRRRGTGGNDLHPTMGYNFKYTDLQAAVGLAQISRLSNRLEFLDKRDHWYHQRLERVPGVKLPTKRGEGEHRQWTDVLIKDRQALVSTLDKIGYDCRPFWHPIHTQAPYAQSATGAFPVTTKVSSEGLWLPSDFRLTESDIDRICSAVAQVARANISS
jgi:perosamine synthetase